VFILPFVIILSAFFLILWVADLYFTLKSTEKKGRELEANPLMRMLLKERRAHLYIFKALEIICFFALVYLISFQSADYAVIIFLVAIGIYALVVSNGMAIYLRITKKHSIPSLLLFFTCVTALFFAYLAYETFANGASLFSSCSKCCEQYAALKASCTSGNAPVGQNRDYGLNITLPS